MEVIIRPAISHSLMYALNFYFHVPHLASVVMPLRRCILDLEKVIFDLIAKGILYIYSTQRYVSNLPFLPLAIIFEAIYIPIILRLVFLSK